MPVEIRELVIKAIITSGNDDANDNVAAPQTTLQSQQQLVQECVAQVLKVIQQSQNR